MSDLDFSFEPAAWELALEKMKSGDYLSVLNFLTLLEGEDEAEVDAALCQMEQQHIGLDISDLPMYSDSGSDAVRLRQEQELVKKGQLLQGLEENDPLRLYLEELAAAPAAGDPVLLAKCYLEGDESAASRLAELMLSRVVELAQKAVGKGVFLLDLIQEGSLGLWQGIMSYDGGDIYEHADWWIRQYIARAITLQARSNGVGQKLRQGLEDYRDVDEDLLTELGRNPTPEEIAQRLHMSAEETEVLESMILAARVLEQAHASQKPKETTPEDDQPAENTAYFQSRQRIEELLSGLDEKDAKLLSLRFGLEGSLPLSAQQVGQRLGMTSEEVTARETAALQKLRTQQE